MLPTAATTTLSANQQPPTTIQIRPPPPPPPPPVILTAGDDVDYVRTEMDELLAEVYNVEYVHDNDGSHITRTIPGSKEDSDFLHQLLPYPLHQYNLPNNGFGRHIVEELAVLVDGVVEGGVRWRESFSSSR